MQTKRKALKLIATGHARLNTTCSDAAKSHICEEVFRNLTLTCLLALMAVGTARAGDGVLEINQACALHGGCFRGDTGGFPVTIDGSAGLSYKLTGSLDLATIPNTPAIEISAPLITLDLHGFQIRGAVTCSGQGSTLNCGALGSADGVAVSNGAEGVVIRNGTVRNMSRHGISSNSDLVTIRDIRAFENAGDGLRGQNNSLVFDSMAVRNGRDGFDFGVSSVVQRSTANGNGDNGFELDAQKAVATACTSRFNGNAGFVLGHSSRYRENTSDLNQSPDACGGGVCTERRRFYLTPIAYEANQVLSVCEDGWSLASLTELLEIGHMQYDYVLGLNSFNSGTGAPATVPFDAGWIRTGTASSATNLNCQQWTTDSFSEQGYAARLADVVGRVEPAERISPWIAGAVDCSLSRPVWCIED